MRGRHLAAGLLLLWPAAAQAAKAIPSSPASYVHNENVVSSTAEQSLSQALRDVEQKTGHQFAVALFESLESESLEDYSNKVFRAWKIGDAKRNDGLLFCLYKNDRRWRVEVGYGLEGTLTDLEAAEIARNGVPFFKRGDLDGGVLAVVAGLAAKLEGKAAPAAANSVAPALDLALWFKILLVFLIIGMPILQYFMAWTLGPRARRSGASFIDFTGGGGFGGGGDWSSGGGGFSGGGGSSGGGGASGGW